MIGDNEVFVFGSNTQGRHGKGAALDAWKHHGASYGQARGSQGRSYAIVTRELRRGMPAITLEEIAAEVKKFVEHASSHPHLRFKVTPIGCGLAGFTPDQIAPMFRDAPDNVQLPEEFTVVFFPGFRAQLTVSPPAS
jgi:hypothetical protein